MSKRSRRRRQQALAVRGASAPAAFGAEPFKGKPEFKPAKTPVDVDEARWYASSDFREPSVRTYARWSPADLRSAQIQADSGDLRLAADLCEAILGDDRAPAVLNTRVNAVLGSELSFERGKGRSRKATSAVRKLEGEEDWYQAFDETVLAQLLIWGRLLGVGLAQNKWREFKDHGGRLIPVAENYHARFLCWRDHEQTWKVKHGTLAQELPICPGDGKWIVFTPYGKNRPWAHGLWRGMARLWLLKQYALDDWGKHSEVHGNPIKLGIPPKTGEANHGVKRLREELAQDLADMAANATIVLPPGFDFKLVEATANTWEMFLKQIDMANSGMSIMAIGSNLPTEVGDRAQTGATAQNLVRIDYKKADAEALSTMAHDQSLVWWAEFNFGDPGLAPWPVWDVDPPADHKARADVIKTVADAMKTFADAGVSVDRSAMLEEFEIKESEAEQMPQAALPALAEAHNAAHADPRRRTSVETLRAVWGRGASLAADGQRDAWAMGRVKAFLHLLAEGRPEHEAYVADNDLLPEGHERRRG